MISFLIALGAPAASPARCPPVQVAVAQPATLSRALVRQVVSNFASAYAKACAEGLIQQPLVTAKDRRLFLLNAPAANVASIYERDGRMVLEYPFLSGGKANVPTADELHETIYCAVKGATQAEQEESGRCLPD